MKEVKISKQGTIALPKELKERFGGSEALLIESDKDLLILRKPARASLTEIAERLRAVGKEITPQDIEREIQAVRAQRNRLL